MGKMYCLLFKSVLSTCNLISFGSTVSQYCIFTLALTLAPSWKNLNRSSSLKKWTRSELHIYPDLFSPFHRQDSTQRCLHSICPHPHLSFVTWVLQSWLLMPLKWLSLRSPIPVVKHLTSVVFAHINHVTVLKLCFLEFYEAMFSSCPSCFSDHFSVFFSRHLFLCSSLNVSDPQGSVLALFSSLLDDLHHFCAFNYHPYCVSSGFPKSIHQDVIRCARDLLGEHL